MSIPRQYRIVNEHILSDGFGNLKLITYEKSMRDGAMHEEKAELYDTGNAAAVLPCDRARGTVILIRQLRIATVYNGHPEGIITEAIAGKIEGDLTPGATVIKEAREETGYALHSLKEVMQPYVSPGAFTERIHLFTAAYDRGDKHGEGGGRPEEGENIEVLELPFNEALEMVSRGEIMDAKTILLLQWAALNGVFDDRK